MDYTDFGHCECQPICPKEQTHVHEVIGSVQFSERAKDPHNHRFAAVSAETVSVGKNDHIHEVKFKTDFYEDHYHEFSGRTRGAIPVGDGRHVHFLDSVTEKSDGHRHKFRVATLIDDPISD